MSESVHSIAMLEPHYSIPTYNWNKTPSVVCTSTIWSSRPVIGSGRSSCDHMTHRSSSMTCDGLCLRFSWHLLSSPSRWYDITHIDILVDYQKNRKLNPNHPNFNKTLIMLGIIIKTIHNYVYIFTPTYTQLDMYKKSYIPQIKYIYITAKISCWSSNMNSTLSSWK